MALSNWSGVFAVKLIGAHNGVVIPVGPVHPIFENRHGKRMADGWAGSQDHSSVGSVIVAASDEIHFGVNPEQSPIRPIQRDAVGPLDVRIDKHLPVRSIHAGTLDPRRAAPIRPVKPAFNGIYSDRSRLLEPVGEKRLAESSLQVRHLDRVLGGIGPVQMAIDPVDSQSVGIDHVAESHDGFGFTFVDRRFVDALVVDVAPVQHAALEMKVQCRRAVRLIDNGRQIATVEWEATDIRPVGEKQSRVPLISLAARPVVRVPRVARQALALEAAFFVDARLRARSSFKTLIHVCVRREQIVMCVFLVSIISILVVFLPMQVELPASA